MAFFSSMVWSREFMHTRFYLLFGFFFFFCVFSLLNASRSYQSFVALCVYVFEMIKTIAARIAGHHDAALVHIVAFTFWYCHEAACRTHTICVNAHDRSKEDGQWRNWQWGEMESVRESETYVAAVVDVVVVFVVDRRRLHRRRAPFSWNSGR